MTRTAADKARRAYLQSDRAKTLRFKMALARGRAIRNDKIKRDLKMALRHSEADTRPTAD